MARTMTRTDGKQPRKPDGTGDGEPRLPFAVSRSKRATLVEQVADGLRTCILSGVYRPGDVLPTTRGLAEELGVSRIVTRAAVRRLAADGLVNPKPRSGWHHGETDSHPPLSEMPDTTGDEIPAEAMKFATFLKLDPPKKKSHPSRGNIH